MGWTGRRLRAAAGLAVLLGLTAGCSAGPAEPDGSAGAITVFAAASLEAPFEELRVAFEEEHSGMTVERITYDGSSVLATQIVEGADVDVFASADRRTMETVADRDLLDGEPRTLAGNVLAIAVAPGNPLGIRGLDDLATAPRDGGPTTVVCAPEVPCGALAVELADLAGVHVPAVSEELSVTAVLTKVRLGEADAGLVYRSDIRAASGAVEEVTIEGASERPTEYRIGVLERSSAPDAAAAFVEFARGEQGRAILERAGLLAP